MGYRLSRKAEEDVISICLEGVAQFGLHQAEHCHDRLEKSFRFLAENPLAAPERLEITPPIRIYPTGTHLIAYRVDDEGIFSLSVFVMGTRTGRLPRRALSEAHAQLPIAA